jgi:hypothetical protein
MRIRGYAVIALLAAVATTGCTAAGAGEKGGLPASPTGSTSGPDLSDATLWFAFEDESVDFDGATVFPDALDGPFDGRVVTAAGGVVERTPGPPDRGLALAFPSRCAAPSGCPRAIVEVASEPSLDPGDNAFEFGASVWLAPDQTTAGSNIMQKGRFAVSGGLWKLQVDGERGEPSCVLRSGSDLVEVRSRVSIADSAWHRVSCTRDHEGLSIRVDDTVDRVAGPTGAVNSTWPVRIGGPGLDEHDDQFHGRIDDAYLRIER